LRNGLLTTALLVSAHVTREEDEIGIATPDLVIAHEGQHLVVEGEGFMGQYQPLSRASLEEKLDME